MFTLPDFKSYAVIQTDNLADDALIMSVLFPSSAQTIASILGLPDTAPAKAQGVVQFQRGEVQGEVTITPLHRFLLPGSKLRYAPTSEVNIPIAGDKAEQNINVQAVSNGEQYNTLSGDFLDVIPALPAGAKALNLGAQGGKFGFTLPDSPSVTQAIFICCLYFFEHRAFLKKDVRPAIMKEIIGVLSKDRSLNIERFIPEVGGASAQ